MDNRRRLTISSYYALNLNEFNMSSHTHERHEIMYVVDGTCFIDAGNERYRLLPKNYIIIRSGMPHSLYIERGSPCVLLNLEFAESRAGLDLDGLCEREPLLREFWDALPDYKIYIDSEKVCFALKDLIGELERPQNSANFIELLFSRLLIELARCSGRGVLLRAGVGYVNRARDYIVKNFDRRIDTAEIAASVGLNRSYLQSLFTKYYGMGMIACVIHLRLDKACFLLKNTSKNITDIAFETGFNSRQEFGYNFSRRYGQSPSEYRKLTARLSEVDTVVMKRNNPAEPNSL